MTRTRTPDRREGTATTIRMQRCCNGCGGELGDATDTEIDAAVDGRPLPDVRSECPACSPETADCPACDQPAIERCVACGRCACDRHDNCARPASGSGPARADGDRP